MHVCSKQMWYICLYLVVIITRPPENTVVCRGSNVTISCGYLRVTALPVSWIINLTSLTQQQVVDSPLYQLNNPISPMSLSLTAFSINDTTTFQCVVQSTPVTISAPGTVTVIGTYTYVYKATISSIFTLLLYISMCCLCIRTYLG